jgi:cyanophycin synthetase
MGEPGDLVLIFADALVRSWKQITKFKPSGAPAAQPALHPAKAPFASSPSPGNANGFGTAAAAEVAANFNLEGLIRDERGIRMAPESDD